MQKEMSMIKSMISHPWDLSIEDALRLQEKLASKVINQDEIDQVKYVGGIDVAYDAKSDRLVAAVIIIDIEIMHVIETSVEEDIARFPYIPGLFSFRELPSVAKALEKIKTIPDIIICDGQGMAHPRRFGLACHLGVMYDIPTIGCGKTKYIGEFDEPRKKRGDKSPLYHNNEIVGSVLRTQDKTKPVFVSVGHKISLNTACDWVLKLCTSYRLPETTREADHFVRGVLNGFVSI